MDLLESIGGKGGRLGVRALRGPGVGDYRDVHATAMTQLASESNPAAAILDRILNPALNPTRSCLERP